MYEELHARHTNIVKMRKFATSIIATSVLLAGALFGGFRWGRGYERARISPRTDTVYVNRWRQLAVEPFKLETVQYTMPYYIFLRDSSGVGHSDSIAVPVVQREYRDSTYSAVVSGPKLGEVGPVLQSLELRQQTQYITRTIATPDNKRWGIGPMVGVGISISDNKVTFPVVAGISIHYSLFQW